MNRVINQMAEIIIVSDDVDLTLGKKCTYYANDCNNYFLH